MGRPRKKARRSFGAVSQLPSGRFRARYNFEGGWHNAPGTFAAEIDAEGWLASERRLIDLGQWIPPKERLKQERLENERQALTFGDYFEKFVSQPSRSTTTQATYRSMYRNGIQQKLGQLPLTEVSRADISDWWAWLKKEHPNRDSRNADSYTLVASVFNAAVDEELIAASPCRIPNAGKKPDTNQKELLSTAQLQGIARAMPKHYRLAVLTAAACALRIGEWSELRKKDVRVQSDSQGNVVAMSLYISRQVTENPTTLELEVGKTKNRRNREVPVPAGLVPYLVEHIQKLKREDLLFPNSVGTWTNRRRFNKSLKLAGARVSRGDVSSHDLRHYGGTMFTQSGATLAEAMSRLGHSTTTAAMRYQHATEERARQLANRMAMPDIAEVVSLEEHKTRKQKGA